MRVSGIQSIRSSQPYGNIGDPYIPAAKKPDQKPLSRAEIQAAISKIQDGISSAGISKKPLLIAQLTTDERISEAKRLTERMLEGLNGFASKTAEASGVKISPSDCPRLSGAYDSYVEIVGLYKDALKELWPDSPEAMQVRQLLIGVHELGIITIERNIEAVDFAPKEKRHKLYFHWEGCITEAIRELFELRR